jgi:hypothetical protein
MSRRESAKPLPYVAVWRNAIRDSELDKTAKLVAFVLSTYMDAAGRAFPSKATLSLGASLGAGKRAVDKAIVRLEEAGLLQVTRSRGRRSFRYQAVLTSRARAGLNGANGCDVQDSNVAYPDFQRRTKRHSTSQTGATESGFEVERESGAVMNDIECKACGGDLDHDNYCDSCSAVTFPLVANDGIPF